MDTFPTDKETTTSLRKTLSLKRPAVTVVIATYNRPEVLRVAVRSVLIQTFQDFRIFVIGDNCDERTQEAICSFSDDRITYLNLPVRFGEQSGPNSIGMMLADTRFIAFLNHDDIFLPDHLECALNRLSLSRADVYFARTAFAYRIKLGADGTPLPLFSRIHDSKRRLSEGFWNFHIFEPASAWVFNRRILESIGPWRSSRELFRPALQDWGLRVWRSRTRVCFGSEISVLKVTTQYSAGANSGAYSHPSDEHPALERLLRETPLEELRREIIAEVGQQHRIRARIRRIIGCDSVNNTGSIIRAALRILRYPILRLFLNPITAGIYREFGFDAFNLLCRLAGRRRGWMMDRISISRVGTKLPHAPSLSDALERVQPLIGDRR